MEERIKDKIKEIEGYLEELESILPENFEDYNNQFEKKAACERYFEKIVEAILDLAFLFIKERKLKSPDNDKHAFEILKEVNVIPQELSEKLQDAKGMRNIIAHEYGKIDDELVFDAVSSEIINDSKEFIKFIEEELK